MSDICGRCRKKKKEKEGQNQSKDKTSTRDCGMKHVAGDREQDDKSLTAEERKTRTYVETLIKGNNSGATVI